MLGLMRDDPKGRSEIHYGWGVELGYRNIKRLLMKESKPDEKKIDYGIKWVHSVIRDFYTINGSVRDSQSADQLNAFIDLSI